VKSPHKDAPDSNGTAASGAALALVCKSRHARVRVLSYPLRTNPITQETETMFRIGKEFHLLHVVSDLDAADEWYDRIFSVRRFVRNYMKAAMRKASLVILGDFVMEPAQPVPAFGGDALPSRTFQAGKLCECTARHARHDEERPRPTVGRGQRSPWPNRRGPQKCSPNSLTTIPALAHQHGICAQPVGT